MEGPSAAGTAGTVGDSPKKPRKGSAEMITNPIILRFFRVVVYSPRVAIAVLIAVWIPLLVLSGPPYKNLYDEDVACGRQGSTLDTGSSREDDVLYALTHDFKQKMEGPPTLTTMVMWTDPGTNLGGIDGVAQLTAQVQRNAMSSLKDPLCSGFGAQLGLPTASPDGSALSVTVIKQNTTGGIPSKCELVIHDSLKELSGRVEGVSVAVGSMTSAAGASLDSAVERVSHHFKILVPVLLVLLFLIVGSLSRAVLSMITIMIVMRSINAPIYVIRVAWPGFDITGSDMVMQFTILALGVDYALFFWTRFSQERRRAPEQGAYEEAVMTTLKTSGCVIMMSVMALVTVFTGYLFYPDMNGGDLKRNIQMLFGVLMLGTFGMAVPAAFTALFPSLFEEPESGLCVLGFEFKAAGAAFQKFSPLSFYFDRSGWISKSPWKYCVPLAVYAALVPLLVVLATKKINYDLAGLVMARTIPEYEAYQVVMNRFASSRAVAIPLLLKATPVGPSPSLDSGLATSMMQVMVELAKLQPFAVAAQAAGPISLSPGFGRAVCRFVAQLREKTNGTSYEIGARDLMGVWLNPATGECVEAPTATAPFDNLISLDGKAQVMYLFPHFPPMGEQAKELTYALKDEIQPSAETTFDVDGQRYKFGVDHTSPLATVLRMEEHTKHAAMWILPAIAIVVCLLFGITFSSVGIAVKVGATVILPICASYGITVGVFQYGWFEGLGVMKVEDGVFYKIFYTGMGFLFALAVDYDMFLFARVFEYRHEGYDNRSSVVLALRDTGPVITTAGTIMCMSFFTMCFTDVPSIQMLAFLYFIGIALDTYIVRPFVAPSALVISEFLNFWPGKIPPVTKSVDQIEA